MEEVRRAVAAPGQPYPSGVQRCQDEVTQIFRWLRATPIRGKDPVSVVTAEAVQQVWRWISFVTYTVLFLVSCVSLLVLRTYRGVAALCSR